MTARLDLVGVCKQLYPCNNRKCPQNAFFWYLGTLYGKTLIFSIFKKRWWCLTAWNLTIVKKNWNCCYSSLLLQVLNWWRLSYFLGDISPTLCRTNISFDMQLILEHYCPPSLQREPKTYQNSFGVLDPNLPLLRKRNIAFFKKGTVFPYGSFLAKD